MLNTSRISVCQCGTVKDETSRTQCTMRASGYQDNQAGSHRRRFSVVLFSVTVLTLINILPVPVHTGVISTVSTQAQPFLLRQVRSEANTNSKTKTQSDDSKIQTSVVLLEPKGIGIITND